MIPMIRHSRLRDDRGAIIIHVAIALLALIAFSAFVVDMGVMWVSRRQAQNAADAGALAGAVALMKDEPRTEAAKSALQWTSTNAIFGSTNSAANVRITFSGTPSGTCGPACDVATIPPCGTDVGCVRADVFRNTPDRTYRSASTLGSPIPTFFGPLIGVTGQGVRATATAWVTSGNSVECIKPWVVADKWIDNSGTGSNTGGWDQLDTFVPGADSYSPPGFKAEGPDNDYGLELVLKEGQSQNYTSGWTMQIEFGVSGSSAYRDAIEACPDFVPTVGLYDPTYPCSGKTDPPDPTKGCLDVKPGMAQGPTQQGVATLVGRDSSASWNSSTNSISGGCMAAGTCEMSPRVVPLAIFNTAAYVAMDAGNACAGGNCRAQVVNILGFFVEGMCNDVYPTLATRPAYCGTPAEASKAVVGRLMSYPGQYSGVAGAPGPATFLETVRLVR
jgi:Flp pilus assembly protein TadG